MFEIKAGDKVNEHLRALFDNSGALLSWSRMTRSNRLTDMNSICSPPNLIS